MGLALPPNFLNAGRLKPRPSGFTEIPQPFVIRAEHLRGLALAPNQPFTFDINIFDQHLDRPAFLESLIQMANSGIGPDRTACLLGELTWTILNFELAAPLPSHSAPLTLHFVTPLELRSNNQAVQVPEFPVLMARLRDRVSALTFFYERLLNIDFLRFNDIAKSVNLVSHNLAPQTARRHSTRTGQWHPLNGITGTAAYEGPWRSYENWLRLGEYTGVGKQTSFGKGVFRIIEPLAME